MVGLLQDLLDIGYPYLFLISVAVAIIAAMCTAFYFDHENRKRGRRQKEVCLSSSGDEEPIEELSSEEMETVSEKSEEEDETELEEGESGVEEVGGGAGDEEVVGLMSRLKNARLKEIEEALTEEQLKSEKEIEQEQLQVIFGMLRKQETDLDMNPMDEHDLKAQLKMYR